MKKKTILTLWLAVMVMCNLSVIAYAAEEPKTGTAEEKIDAGIKTPVFITVSRKGKGKTTVSWGKIPKVSGYEIQYSIRNDFSGARSVYARKGSAASKKISGLSTQKDTYLRMRAYKKVSGKKYYSKWSANARLIVWKSSWEYAGYSKIHSDPVTLYESSASKKKLKKITVAVNAGHGCRGGESKKTLCHPNGTPKVTGGSTAAGSKYATSINSGTTIHGSSEASVNLRVAKKLKEKLLAKGYNVLMIRQDSNTQLDNIARTVMANKNANCHVAIHFDSTSSNKGAFAISVPNVSSYRNMQPVKSHWRQHNALGSDLVRGLRSAGVKIFGSGSMAIDLTQTSYSTVPSVDIEVGDQATSTSDKNLNKIANGLAKGIDRYF